MSDLALSLRLTAPEEVLSLGAMLLLMIGVFRGDRSYAGLTWVSVIFFAVAGALVVLPGSQGSAFSGLIVADNFSAFFKVLIAAAAVIAALLAIPYLKRSRTARFEYPVILMLAVLGLFIMVSANNLITLYLGLELGALAQYVMAAFHRNEARSSEAGLKYFVLGSLSSGILLYGISLVYGFAGSTSFATLHTVLAHGLTIGPLIGLVLVMVGLAFKIAAVPFHMWTPDVYEGAPTPVAAFFASAPKVAAMGLLVRASTVAFGGATDSWRQIIAFMAVASMFLGAFGAIGQSNLKRLLAYSSINNVGFALIGLACGTRVGVASVLFYMAVYLAMTLGAFLVVLDLRDPDGRPLERISDLVGLRKSRPGLAAALAIFMFSLAGIPPLLGFWPKFAVFDAAVGAGLFPLAVIGVVASVVGAYYYLRIVKTIYFDEPTAPVAPRLSIVNGALMAGAAIFCSPIGMLAITPIVGAARAAAASLF